MKKYLLTAATSLLMFSAGAQWIAQDAGFTNDTLGFYEISITDRQTAWAICYDGKFGLFSNRSILDFTRTTDGGNTWQPGKMGSDNTLRFSTISAIDGNEAWVAMHKKNFSTGGGVYHTTDGGLTWEHNNPGELFNENSFPNVVYFKDRNKGIAIGDPNDGYFEIYTTMNRGLKWKRVDQVRIPASLPNEYGWFGGYAAVGNTVWFGTSSGRMYKSDNFGKDWTVSTVDPGGKTVYEIAFNDDGLHGVTHLRDFNNITYLYTTSDGGQTWTNRGQPAGWKSSRITAVPGTNSFVSTSVNGFDRGSSVSHDNGLSWTLLAAIPMAAARFIDETTGWGGSFFVTGPPYRGGIYKSGIAFPAVARNVESKPALQPGGQNEGVKVYPTPASDILNITFPGSNNNVMYVISLIDMNGKHLETRKMTGTQLQMDVSGFRPGTYTVRISGGGQTINKIISIIR